MKEQEHINYALVESVRPAMYSAMKYWGKKPHNIWSEFIETYCPENGIVFDPFAGSAISAFEALKLNRKAIAFDLNPLTSFFIEVLSSTFDENEFKKAFNNIYNSVVEDEIYVSHYNKIYNGKESTIYNFRWIDGKINKVALVTFDGEHHFVSADEDDIKKSAEIDKITIPYWYPTKGFPSLLNISYKFINDIGGNSFQYLWTRRNLYILAKIFDEIENTPAETLKMQLLSGFIQTLHLVSKMVVPRNPKSNRDFSGSWGRADYMIRRRSMEQNPLVVFKRACLLRQGVVSMLRDANKNLPLKFNISDITVTKKVKKSASINYGIVDIADISKYLKSKTIDFIITDPPYAGLVPYLDLSMVWLVWLEKINKKYQPDLNSEITIKKGKVGRDEYRRRLNNAFKQLHNVLKDDGFIVITFHHQKIQEWNDFVQAVKLAGFKFDKVTHQFNRRSGESNVSNPYGTSGADFYIRCVKHRDVDFTDDISGLSHFVIQKAIEIIALRNEPTPYEFLVNGLVPELLQAGYLRPSEYQDELLRILKIEVGQDKIFKKIENIQNKAGDILWFNNPSEFIAYPDLPLQDRVEQTIISILKRKISVRLDDVLGELFRMFPNGLTPDPRNIRFILEKYAYRSANNWKIKPTTIVSVTRHTEYIEKLIKIGLRAGFKVYVGKREQSESCSDGGTLKDKSTYTNLNSVSRKYQYEQLKRIEMIDLIWLSNENEIVSIFEVENSTGFISAIQRASNIEKQIYKFMVIPDEREKEIQLINDPLFIKSFRDYNWKFITYSGLERLTTFSNPSIDEIKKISKNI